MPQLSLYVDDETMDLLRKNADDRNVSLSRYARDLIRDRDFGAWPMVSGISTEHWKTIPSSFRPSLIARLISQLILMNPACGGLDVLSRLLHVHRASSR